MCTHSATTACSVFTDPFTCLLIFFAFNSSLNNHHIPVTLTLPPPHPTTGVEAAPHPHQPHPAPGPIPSPNLPTTRWKKKIALDWRGANRAICDLPPNIAPNLSKGGIFPGPLQTFHSETCANTALLPTVTVETRQGRGGVGAGLEGRPGLCL